MPAALWSLGSNSEPAGGTVLNWDAINTFAELVGAVAVLITLGYLAIQTRDNVRVMRSRAVWDAQVSFVEVNEVLGEEWLTNELFRFGASSLANDVLLQLVKMKTGNYQSAHYFPID